MKTKDLVLISFYSALFGVLEYVTVTFGFLKMPQGGSISLSIIVLIIASYHLGVKKSLMVVGVSFVIMFLIEPPFIVNWIQFLADYILAFAVYAFACCFRDIKVGNVSIPTGVIVTTFLGFMAHNIAGWFFFAEYYPGDVLWGVSIYNATYMLPTMILSTLTVMVVKPRLEKEFN